MANTVVVQIVGDASKLGSTLREAEGQVGGFSSRLTDIGKSMVGGVLGGFAAVNIASVVSGVVDQIGSALDQATESIKVGKETARVIQTMGGVANVTAKQVGDLADKISLKTGVDDEAIQSGSNLLLTFGNVRNELGKGNKVFDQATKLALDMSKALGTDMKSSALQLGKALNDPTQGLTALRRAGVSFTEEQVAQIKAMQDSGNILGAQKFILAEVGREFKGAAETAATPMEKLKVAVDNVKEKIGLALLPVVEKLANWFAEKGVPAIQNFIEWLQKHWPEIEQAFEDAWSIIGPILEQMWERVQTFARIVADVVDFVSSLIHGDFSEAWDAFKRLIGDAVDFVMELFGNLPRMLVDAVGDLGEMLANAIIAGFKAAWNAAADLINDIIPDKIGFDTPFGFVGIDLPNNPIPRLASGGIVTKPTLALIGEAGPEAVVPLNGRGGMGVNINIEKIVSPDPMETPIQLARRMRQQMFLAGV